MGQKPSSFRRISSVDCLEDSNEDIWVEIVHVSDRDVLVKDVSGKIQQKVKLKGGRRTTKFDNVHLGSKKRLEGVQTFKKGKKNCGSAGSATGSSTTGITNHAFSPPENCVRESTTFVNKDHGKQADTLANKLWSIPKTSPKEAEQKAEVPEYKRQNERKRDNVFTSKLKRRSLVSISHESCDEESSNLLGTSSHGQGPGRGTKSGTATTKRGAQTGAKNTVICSD